MGNELQEAVERALRMTLPPCALGCEGLCGECYTSEPEVRACCLTRTVLAALSQTGVGWKPDREAVARAIDPQAWADRLPVPTRGDVIDFHERRQASVAVADRVLSLPPQAEGDKSQAGLSPSEHSSEEFLSRVMDGDTLLVRVTACENSRNSWDLPTPGSCTWTVEHSVKGIQHKVLVKTDQGNSGWVGSASIVANETRSCTCHPDDAVLPCARRYAASECQAAPALSDGGLRERAERAEAALAEARAAILRANAMLSDMSEGWLEEARQASVEGNEAEDRKCCAKAATYDRVSNAMQPALGAALRAAREAALSEQKERGTGE